MYTVHAPTPATRARPPAQPAIQLTVIQNDTGRRICSFPSWLDMATATSHLQFEEEAWHRAVQQRRVNPFERHLYSIELS